MRAVYKGVTIAESEDTVSIEGNHYFPIDSINEDHFENSDHTSFCPWKGTASYMHVLVGGEKNTNAAWYYAEPKEAAKVIKGRLAFWKGVEVQE